MYVSASDGGERVLRASRFFVVRLLGVSPCRGGLRLRLRMDIERARARLECYRGVGRCVVGRRPSMALKWLQRSGVVCCGVGCPSVLPPDPASHPRDLVFVLLKTVFLRICLAYLSLDDVSSGYVRVCRKVCDKVRQGHKPMTFWFFSPR